MYLSFSWTSRENSGCIRGDILGYVGFSPVLFVRVPLITMIARLCNECVYQMEDSQHLEGMPPLIKIKTKIKKRRYQITFVGVAGQLLLGP